MFRKKHVESTNKSNFLSLFFFDTKRIFFAPKKKKLWQYIKVIRNDFNSYSVLNRITLYTATENVPENVRVVCDSALLFAKLFGMSSRRSRLGSVEFCNFESRSIESWGFEEFDFEYFGKFCAIDSSSATNSTTNSCSCNCNGSNSANSANRFVSRKSN